MTSASWRHYAALLLALAATVAASTPAGTATGMATIFGPRTLTRGTGEPVTERATFAAVPSSDYQLRVESDGVASALIILNGATVIDPADFNPGVRLVERKVALKATNEISIQLRGTPGSRLVISIQGADPINIKPVVSIARPSPVTLPQTATLSATVSDDGRVLAAPTLTWSQVSGPGTATFSPQPASGRLLKCVVSFSAAGTYVLRLSAFDGEFTASADATVLVKNGANRAPTASAGGPYTGTVGQPIAFSGSGSDPDGNTLSYAWQFGDGATGTGATPTHAYAAAGSFTATLTVNDGRGGTATSTAAVTITTPPPVNRPPTANAGGPYAANIGEAIAFGGSGTDPDGDTLTYAWSFGDGGTGTGATPTHAYTAAGSFTATLTVDDGRGGTATSTATVTITTPPPVNRPPTANAGGPYGANVGEAIAFGGSGTDPDGDTLTYAWSFGDGATGTGATPTHAYAAAGSFTATLTVNDGRGGTATSTATVTITTPPPVNRPPTANAGGPYAANAGEAIAFGGSGTDPDGDTLTYAWSFGDGGDRHRRHPDARLYRGWQLHRDADGRRRSRRHRDVDRDGHHHHAAARESTADGECRRALRRECGRGDRVRRQRNRPRRRHAHVCLELRRRRDRHRRHPDARLYRGWQLHRDADGRRRPRRHRVGDRDGHRHHAAARESTADGECRRPLRRKYRRGDRVRRQRNRSRRRHAHVCLEFRRRRERHRRNAIARVSGGRQLHHHPDGGRRPRRHRVVERDGHHHHAAAREQTADGERRRTVQRGRDPGGRIQRQRFGPRWRHADLRLGLR